MTVPLWPCKDKKTTPCSQCGKGADDGSLMSTQEWGRRWSSPLPQFSIDYKTTAHSVLRVAPSGLPACKPQKHPILINHFLSITSPLDEFFLCWDKNTWAPRSPQDEISVISSYKHLHPAGQRRRLWSYCDPSIHLPFKGHYSLRGSYVCPCNSRGWEDETTASEEFQPQIP